MLYTEAPVTFRPSFEVVSCYVEYGDEIVLLRRNINKSQGNRWGVPAGKVKHGEGLYSAMLRELREETGIIMSASRLKYLDKLYIEHSGYQFIYHMFTMSLDSKPTIKIRPQEHYAYCWLTFSEALKMELVADLAECITRLCSDRAIRK